MKKILFLLVMLLLCTNMVWAKSFSSSSRSSSSSSSRSSFSSTPSKSFSSSSSSPSKSFSSTTRSSFGAASPSYKPSARTFNSQAFSSPKVTRIIKVQPRAYAPSTYGKYSNHYYAHSSAISPNSLMFYLALDSMSDAAIMTAMANRDAGFDDWKREALAQDNAELREKVLLLEAKMAGLNASSVNASYVAPEIQEKLKAGVDGAAVMQEDTSEDFDGMLFLWVTTALCSVPFCVWFFSGRRLW